MLAHLQHAWNRAVGDGLDPHLAVDREKRIFELVCRLDPTANGHYLMWLSRWRRGRWDVLGVANPDGNPELSKLASALDHFEEAREFLAPDSRDIMGYRTVDQLMNARNAMPEPGARELRRRQKRDAMAGSEMLFDGAGWKLVQQMTRDAAKWWGLGTRWCTAATFDNSFERYAAKGDLWVLITPVDRYQLSQGTSEFRDSADRPAAVNVALAGAPADLQRLFGSLAAGANLER